MSFFFFNDTATTEIYTLSLHDALPISESTPSRASFARQTATELRRSGTATVPRSEEHTSELQSRLHLVCRLLLEKKKHRIGGDAGATTVTPFPEVAWSVAGVGTSSSAR